MRGLMTVMVLGLFAGYVAAQDRADLTGAWKLNPERTAQAELRSLEDRAAIAGRRAPIGGGGPVGVGGSGRTPGSMGPTDYPSSRGTPEEIAKAREAVRLALLVPERLTIVRDETGFTLTDGQGVATRWRIDGKTVRSQAGALSIDTKAKWDGAVLVVERKFEGDVKATERYSVAGNPRQLTISTKVETNKIPGERSRTMQRVYDLQ